MDLITNLWRNWERSTRTLHRIQEAILEYDFEIHYKKGSEMPADYLSRNISIQFKSFIKDSLPAFRLTK